MKSSPKVNAGWRVRFFFLALIPSMLILVSCQDFVAVDPPFTSLNQENVFTNDAAAVSVLNGIYTTMSDQDAFADGFASIFIYAALSSDELTLFAPAGSYPEYYRNDLTNLSTGGNFWSTGYRIIFVANSAIEGLNSVAGTSPTTKQQLLGEAKFIRAFTYFYLVNLFGDVPLIVSTDYKVNQVLPRAPKAQVYQQIVTDLVEAQALLSPAYLSGDLRTSTSERVRPTTWAATALLARVYLYMDNYGGAAGQSSAVINGPYGLATLNSAFLKNSTEAIWQLQPVRTGTQSNTGSGYWFILPPGGPTAVDNPFYLSNNVVNSFALTDQRRSNWVDSVTVGGTTYHYAYKYKIGRVTGAVSEYTMVLRLGEQYLIRAEARAQMGDVSGALADLNAIRARAGLADTTLSTQAELLNGILRERQVELFTEWGHRWFDLRRMNSIDAVMSVVTPQKGGAWATYKALYPIPQSEITLNPKLVQNPGY